MHSNNQPEIALRIPAAAMRQSTLTQEVFYADGILMQRQTEVIKCHPILGKFENDNLKIIFKR